MDLKELICSIDIVDFISQYVDLEEKGGEFWGLSPFQDEKTPSFSVRRESNTWYDFSSGLGGNVYTFIRHYNSCSPGEAIEVMKKYINCDETGIVSREKLAATKICRKFLQDKRQKATNMMVLPDDYMDRYENRPEKLEIWRKEGITDEAMQFFGVKYDSFSNCIVYPIRNENGVMVNVGGRTLDPDFKEKGLRKYTYFKKWGGQMSLIYGLFDNLEYIKEKKEIILFEGMKSVLLARGYGFKNTGALLTSHLNPGQMKILVKLGCRVVFALDKEVDIRNDFNIKKLRHYVNVETLYDTEGLLDDKDAPVDKGCDVFCTLYRARRR